MDVKGAVERMKAVSGLRTDGELAERLDVPIGTLNSWKKRKAMPFEALARFCALYGASLDFILNNEHRSVDPAKLTGIEGRAYRLALRITLETSGLPQQSADIIRSNVEYFRRMIVSLVEHQVKTNGVPLDDAFKTQEEAVRELYTPSTAASPNNGPNRPIQTV